MSQQQEERFYDLIDRALDLEPEERRKFLESECGDDQDLLSRVWEAVDSSDEDLSDFLAAPAYAGGAPAETTVDLLPEGQEPGIARVSAPDVEEELPDRIGPFFILDSLGSGGMGRVYLAEQRQPVHRKVALKVMHNSLQGTASRARFQAERQALARLSHPNVGQILEAGTTADGFPFFAMEWVPGEPIHRAANARRLTIEERLELIIAVCRGVEHAHQRQVLHRDLKPSNVLVTEVDGRLTPKIIDFGIAKALDSPLSGATLMTAGLAVGTPAYMSPEALAGDSDDLDTRTDVYSLGILLYELLVGVAPHDGRSGSVVRMVHQVLNNDPPRPSQRLASLDEDQRLEVATGRHLSPPELKRRLAGDLDWITLRAVARGREDRYGSAAELAADLEKHLQHEPVEAGPPSAVYRFSKLLRRHRGVAIATLLLFLALGAGLVARTFEARRASAAAELARQSQRQAEQARDEAQQVTQFLVDLFSAADPRQTQGRQVDAIELLDLGAGELAEHFDGPPSMQATLMVTVGRVYFTLGRYRDALALAEGALNLRRAEIPPDELAIAATLHDVALYQQRSGELVAAKASEVEALAIRERLLPAGDPAIAASLYGLAVQASMSDRLDEAVGLYGRALAIWQSSLGDETPEVARVHSSLGSAHLLLGRPEKARPLLERSVELSEKVYGPLDPAVASAVSNLAFCALREQRYEESLALYERGLEIRRELFGDDHPSIANSLLNLGGVHEESGDLAAARQRYREAMEIHQRSLGANHMVTARSVSALGKTYLADGDYGAAEPLLRRAWEIRRAALPEGHLRRQESARKLLDLLTATGRADEGGELRKEIATDS
ncbi:MAG: serine/threonine-protein kinase [Acidobacteriota bacterium]